jgi:hypothetical protein
VQPARRTSSSCSAVSIPSAVVSMPRLWPRLAIALMITALSRLRSMSLMKERSILILSNGNERR